MITRHSHKTVFSRLSLLVLLTISTTMAAQAQASWVFEDFYGSQGVSDFGMCVKTTHDGGAITIGSSESFGQGYPVIHVIRVDPLGNPVWENYYDQNAFVRDMSIAECSNLDLVWTASVIIRGQPDYDILVARTEADGTLLWARLVGFDNERDEYASAIVETQNGDIAVSGVAANVPNRGHELIVARFEQDGSWLWSGHYGTEGNDDNHGLTEHSNGNLIAAGAIAANAGGQDAWLLEIDANGNPGWSHSYGPDDGFLDGFRNVIEHPSTGELYAVGNYQRTSGFGSGLIVAVNPNNGAVVHSIHYRHNLAGSGLETCRSIVYAPDEDEFVVCGRYITPNSVVQPYTAAFPPDLSAPLWMLRRNQSEAGVYRSIDLTDGNPDYEQGGGYWIAGSVSEDQTWHSPRRYHSLTRTNWNGKTDCTQELDWDLDPSLDDIDRDIAFDGADEAVEISPKRVAVDSRTEECPGVWIDSHAKSAAELETPPVINNSILARLPQSPLRSGETLQLALTSTDVQNVRIVITDIQGRQYHDAHYASSNSQTVVDISTDAWAAGIYVVQLRVANNIQTLRVLLHN